MRAAYAHANVGMALARTLAQAGHEVSGLRRPGSGESLLHDAGIKPVLADITNPERLQKLYPNYDWVVNCVSATGGGPDAYRVVYLEGMRNLITWLEPAGLTKFVYTSSTSVYGQNDGSIRIVPVQK